MSNIVEWSYYSSFYSNVSEDQFDVAEALAEKEVKLVIGSLVWDTINANTYGYDVLKDCICKVINKMAEDDKSAKGKGITAVSNDGYSESYGITTADQLRSEMVSSIRAWLSGTGLVGAY